MRISNKIFNVAEKYYDRTCVEKTPKYVLLHDLDIMGVSVRPWVDMDTIRKVTSVVANSILENGISE